MGKKVFIVLTILIAISPILANKPDPDALKDGVEIEGITYAYRGHAYPLERIMEGEFSIELDCGDNAGGVDIAFCIDNTGSMGGSITGVRDNISDLIAEMDAREFNYKLGGVCYGDAVAPDSEDWGGARELFDADENLATGWQMTDDFTQFNDWLSTITAWGGADGAENSLCAIMAAANNYDWRENAIHIIVFFTDNTFYETGDVCDGICNYTRAEGYDVIIDGGYILFSSTRDISWDDACTAMNDPIDATFWYENTTTSSGGNWYSLGTGWDVIFDDIVVLVDTFELISFCVTNNTGYILDELEAEITPGSCIEIVSPNPQTYGPWSIGERHCYLWQINSEEDCTGPDACFDLIISGMGFSDTARGCIYIPDCGCPGPTAEPICPPYMATSACPYQEITIGVFGNESGVEASEIRMEVDGHTYVFPENMTFDDNVLNYTPLARWPHNRVVVYNLVDAEDSMGCDLQEEVSGVFLTDLHAPEVTIFDPPCGTEFGDSIKFTWHIEDIPGGIDSMTIAMNVGGTEFTLIDPDLEFIGDTSLGILAEGDLVFKAYSFDLCIMPGDTFTVCLDLSDAVLPSLDSCSLCGPNDTTICCDYSVAMCVGPVASVLCPPTSDVGDTTVSACPDQTITLELLPADFPIDEPTVRMTVNSTIYSLDDDELSFSDEILAFAPPSPWTHGQLISYNLFRADDTRGCALTEPITSFFYYDNQPPQVYDIDPQPGFEFTGTMNIGLWVEDVPAGINYEDIVITIDDVTHTIGDGFMSYAGDHKAGVASISGLPDDFGIARGDTFELCIEVEDLVRSNEGICELCGPNDTVYCYDYMFYPETNCERVPNPFTPNYDNINDYVQFYFPEMYRLDGVISIYNIRNRPVAQIHVDHGAGALQMSRWDGTNFDGILLPEGLYIYVIKTENEVVCEGTITLAR